VLPELWSLFFRISASALSLMSEMSVVSTISSDVGLPSRSLLFNTPVHLKEKLNLFCYFPLMQMVFRRLFHRETSATGRRLEAGPRPT